LTDVPLAKLIGSVTPGIEAVTLSAGSFAKVRYRTVNVKTVAGVPDVGLTVGVLRRFGSNAPARAPPGAATNSAPTRNNAVITAAFTAARSPRRRRPAIAQSFRSGARRHQ